MSVIENLQLDAVEKFAHSAELYCDLIEQPDSSVNEAFIRQCAAALASLYADALALPEVEPCEQAAETTQINSASVYSLAQSQLGKLNAYWRFFDPYNADSGSTSLLGDDLAEIYRDLKEGLHYYRLGTDCAIREAAVRWQFGFMTHWGRHLVGALTALHQIIAENLLANDE